MRIEALSFKNNGGDTVTVFVGTRETAYTNGKIIYHIEEIAVKPYRKRNAVYISGRVTDMYDYRRLEQPERERFMLAAFMEWATPEQLKQAIYNAYEQLAPDTGIIDEVAAGLKEEKSDEPR